MRWHSSLTLRSPIAAVWKVMGSNPDTMSCAWINGTTSFPYITFPETAVLRSTVPRIDLSFFLLRTKIFWRKNRKNSDRQLQYIILRRLYTKRGMWLIKIRFSTYRERLSVSWEPKLFHVTFVGKLRIHCPNQNLNLCINIEPVTVGADATG